MVVSGTKGVVVVGTKCGAGAAWGAVASEANDNDGVVEAGGKSEGEEDHVGCNGEGCPNKCAIGADCGHVDEAVVGCGGVGHDVGGVVHG